MPTKIKKPGAKPGEGGQDFLPPLYSVRQGESHSEVVASMLEKKGHVLLLSIDLNDLPWSVESASDWIRALRSEFQQRSFDRTRNAGGKRGEPPSSTAKPFPIIAVFGTSFSADDSERLVEAGAKVVDRKNPRNKELETPDKLLKTLYPDSPETNVDSAWTKRIQPATNVDPTAFNKYPPGIAPGDITKALEEQGRSI